MPSADSRYVMGSPCGLLTQSSVCCCLPIFVFPAPCGVRLDGGQDAMTHRRRGFGHPVLPDTPVIFQQCQLSRRNGSPGVNTGYFQSAVGGSDIRSTSTTDRGLCPVLRTRPDHTPPQICLTSTLRHGAMRALASRCFLAGYVDPRFCLQLPSGAHCCNTLAFGYPSPPSGWVWTLPGMRVIIPDITI